MLLYAVLIGSSFPVGGTIAAALDPAVLTFLRFTMAAIVFAAVLVLRGKLRMPGWSLIARCIIIGGLMAIFFVAMFEALRWTTALNTGALFTLVPLLASCFGWLINKQTIGLAHFGCLLLGAAGATWIVFDGSLDTLLSFTLGRGEIIFLGGILAFSLYAPALKRLHVGEPAPVFAFWNVVMGAVLLGIYAIPELLDTGFGTIETYVWAGIAYLAVFPTAITFYLSTIATLSLPAYKVMSYTYLTPAVVAVFDAVAFGTVPTVSVVAGIIVVLSVTFLLQASGAKHERGR